jgi:hypothetical protein
VVPLVVLDRLSLFTFYYFGRLAPSPRLIEQDIKVRKGLKSGNPDLASYLDKL